MLSDFFTNLGTNPSLTGIACAYDQAYGGIFTFIILLSLLIAWVFSVFTWNRQDFFGSSLYGSSIITIISLILTLAKADNCEALLSPEQFMFFLVITGLLYIGKKVID